MNTQPKIKVQTDSVNGHEFRMIEVTPVPFMMGSEQYDREQPIHEVLIKRPYFMAEFPVTQALWKAVMGKENNPSYFVGDKRPVEQVLWDDIKEKFLPEIKRQTGIEYRLPTEAEWEFAARGGALSKGYEFAGSNRLKEVGWYWDNSNQETKPVGMKLPNELGLYDMSGNVDEWCEDVWHGDYKGAPCDGTAWMEAEKDKNARLVRGGSWVNYDYLCRVSSRSYSDRDFRNNALGFRFVRY